MFLLMKVCSRSKNRIFLLRFWRNLRLFRSDIDIVSTEQGNIWQILWRCRCELLISRRLHPLHRCEECLLWELETSPVQGKQGDPTFMKLPFKKQNTKCYYWLNFTAIISIFFLITGRNVVPLKENYTQYTLYYTLMLLHHCHCQAGKSDKK